VLEVVLDQRGVFTKGRDGKYSIVEEHVRDTRFYVSTGMLVGVLNAVFV